METLIGSNSNLEFEIEEISADFIHPSGQPVEQKIQIRTNPITGRTCRIAFAREDEKEPGTEHLPSPPPDADKTDNCPFCLPQVLSLTPELPQKFFPSGHQAENQVENQAGRMVYKESILFPNLFPYGSYSAVSIFDNRHFVEIGTATSLSYTNCLINCCNYLKKIISIDKKAVYMAITQNHLPSAGGSLLHPHLQINADKAASNHHRFLRDRANDYYTRKGTYLFADYLNNEIEDKTRYIGATGRWEWMAAFAPEGFFEIWGILPGKTSVFQIQDEDCRNLAQGIVNTQKYYRSICRNGYNLGILFVEDDKSHLEIKVSIMARSNYAAWVRNDHTGFEVMLGDMATFVRPEKTAEEARKFWKSEHVTT
ncbi:galactose-1-phosphate uridylyltransferase [Desulfobacterales bacterium HSG16]|nr:galactose-1-phosphate uridylyltransferase [Desulfobacterales bacterium HSG16]